MVRHIVFWNLQDEANGKTKEENMDIMKEKLEALCGKIDGVIKMEVNKNYNPNGYDLCLYSEFESKEALDAYAVHPLHKEVQAFVHDVITERAVTDSEI